MSKIWLNSAGQVLVDESGRPYLCDECPCGGGGGGDEPTQGSRKILKVNVDFSWTGAPSSFGEDSYLSWYVVWYYNRGTSTTQTITVPTGTVSYGAYSAMRYSFFPDFSSGELKTSFEVIVEDTELSDDCEKISLQSYVNIFANLTITEAPELRVTDNTTTELICETFDLEFE